MAQYIENFLDKISHRWDNYDDETATEIRTAWLSYLENDLLEKQYKSAAFALDDKIYNEVLSEVLIANQLIKSGLKPKRHRNGGPDFFIQTEASIIHVEVTTPSPNGIPLDWLKYKLGSGQAVAEPDHERLLRWTNSISIKGKIDTYEKYVQNGIIKPEDAFVIAINGLSLRNTRRRPELHGDTGYPFAAEACFGLSRQDAEVDTTNGEFFHPYLTKRKFILKKRTEGAEIPTDIFLHEQFSFVSAIWAVDIEGLEVIKGPNNFHQNPMVIVHNSFAKNPISPRLLPAYYELRAKIDDNEMSIHPEPGLLIDLQDTLRLNL